MAKYTTRDDLESKFAEFAGYLGKSTQVLDEYGNVRIGSWRLEGHEGGWRIVEIVSSTGETKPVLSRYYFPNKSEFILCMDYAIEVVEYERREQLKEQFKREEAEAARVVRNKGE